VKKHFADANTDIVLIRPAVAEKVCVLSLVKAGPVDRLPSRHSSDEPPAQVLCWRFKLFCILYVRSGASTPYKTWSKCPITKLGGGFSAGLGGVIQPVDLRTCVSKCHKIDGGWVSHQTPQRSPDPLAGFRGKGPEKGTEKGVGNGGERRRGEEGGTGDLLHGLRGGQTPLRSVITRELRRSIS